jgi:predicted nucleotidyltransferase
MDDLQQSIFKTVAFFDLFSYPLTSWEIFKWLYNPAEKYSYQTVLTKILELEKENKLNHNQGFYFLPQENDLVKTRLLNYSLAQVKYRRAKKFVKVISYFPWIKAICVCNNLAYNNAKEESDIDLFIITAPKRMWLSRLLVVGFLKIIHSRPNQNNKQDTIDTAFFATTNSLNFSDLILKDEDPYFTYWLEQLVPLYGPLSFAEKVREANSWLQKTLPNTNGVSSIMNRQKIISEKSWEHKPYKIFNWLEALAKTIQLQIMPEQLKTTAKENNTGVVMNERWLKFHSPDKRMEYKNSWQKKYETN